MGLLFMDTLYNALSSGKSIFVESIKTSIKIKNQISKIFQKKLPAFICFNFSNST